MTSPQVALLVIASHLLLSLANIHDGSSGYNPLAHGIRSARSLYAGPDVVPAAVVVLDKHRRHDYQNTGTSCVQLQPNDIRIIWDITTSLASPASSYGALRTMKGPRIGALKRPFTVNQLPQTIMAFNLPLDLNTLIVVQTSSTLPSSIPKLGSVPHSLRCLS
ncbi:hypothetical protein EV421DRAFT_1899559 [Armillaria borealis]|uniref:Uncharacterized protein n=1 Tax=Armillaria borealis TaxID=47425 RepID=A0AA39JWD9_9AGAR|nr:hypothetical protein EV421DRAFT_1899559 [Armillaria borealis]